MIVELLALFVYLELKGWRVEVQLATANLRLPAIRTRECTIARALRIDLVVFRYSNNALWVSILQHTGTVASYSSRSCHVTWIQYMNVARQGKLRQRMIPRCLGSSTCPRICSTAVCLLALNCLEFGWFEKLRLYIIAPYLLKDEQQTPDSNANPTGVVERNLQCR